MWRTCFLGGWKTSNTFDFIEWMQETELKIKLPAFACIHLQHGTDWLRHLDHMSSRNCLAFSDKAGEIAWPVARQKLTGVGPVSILLIDKHFLLSKIATLLYAVWRVRRCIGMWISAFERRTNVSVQKAFSFLNCCMTFVEDGILMHGTNQMKLRSFLARSRSYWTALTVSFEDDVKVAGWKRTDGCGLNLRNATNSNSCPWLGTTEDCRFCYAWCTSLTTDLKD